MTLYTIYAKPDKGPDALWVEADSFRWTAFLFTPLWALGRGALGLLVLWVLVVVALVWTAPLISLDAAILLYGVFALWTGFAASRIVGRSLHRREWIERGELAAPDAVTAEHVWLERTYGARP